MLRFGLLGCGHIAKRHAELLGGGRVKGAAIAAVCDIVPERAHAFGSNYGVPFYTSADDLLSSKSVDVVSILTPSGLHYKHCIAAAAAGKHVLVEKPMALRVEHADAMISACETAGVRLFVVKQCRFHAPVRRANLALQGGRFGKLLLASARVWWCRDQAYYDQARWRGTWSLDGGVLMNQAIHHIDLLQWFMGPVTSVHCIGATSLLQIETEDTAVATIKFENGALATIEATTAVRPKGVEASISLLGSSGAVVIGGMAADRLQHWAFSHELPGDSDPLEDFSNPTGANGFGHRLFYEHVVEALSGGPVEVVDGLAGRQSIELAAALYESMRIGQEVPLSAALDEVRLGCD